MALYDNSSASHATSHGTAARPVTMVLPIVDVALEASGTAESLRRLEGRPGHPLSSLGGVRPLREKMTRAWEPGYAFMGAVEDASRRGSAHALYGVRGQMLRTSASATDPRLLLLDEAVGEAAYAHRRTFNAISDRTGAAISHAMALDDVGSSSRSIHRRFEQLADEQDGMAKGWGSAMRGLAYLTAAEEMAINGTPAKDLAKSLSNAAGAMETAARDLSLTARYQPQMGDSEGQTAERVASAGRSYQAAWSRTVVGAKQWGAAIVRMHEER